MQDLRRELLEIVQAEFPFAANNFDEATPFAELGVDSLSQISIVDAIETRFGFRFGDDEYADLVDFRALMRITAAHLAAE